MQLLKAQKYWKQIKIQPENYAFNTCHVLQSIRSRTTKRRNSAILGKSGGQTSKTKTASSGSNISDFVFLIIVTSTIPFIVFYV